MTTSTRVASCSPTVITVSRRACAGLLETAFGTVIMVADEASLLEGARRAAARRGGRGSVPGPRHGDLDWLRALRERCLGMKVVVLSVHDEESVRQAAHGRRSRRLRAQARDRDRPLARDRAPQGRVSRNSVCRSSRTHLRSVVVGLATSDVDLLGVSHQRAPLLVARGIADGKGTGARCHHSRLLLHRLQPDGSRLADRRPPESISAPAEQSRAGRAARPLPVGATKEGS